MVRPPARIRGRYDAVGLVYDVVSLERMVYHRPRLRMLHLLAPPPGGIVIDVGCGTGLNLKPLLAAIGPSGHVVGIDASASMLAAARRRVRTAGWGNVTLLRADAADLLVVLRDTGFGPGRVDAVVATYVLSLLPDDRPVWAAVDALAARRPVRVGITDLAPAASVRTPWRLLHRAAAAAGGVDLRRQPWRPLAERADDVVEENQLGGHVRLAVGTVGVRESTSSGR